MDGQQRQFRFSQSGLREKECLFQYPRPDAGERWAEKIAAAVAGLLRIPHAPAELAVAGTERGVAKFRCQRRRARSGHPLPSSFTGRNRSQPA